MIFILNIHPRYPKASI